MARMNQKRKDAKPKVNKALEGFDIEINSFGEISTSYDISKINEFLDRTVEDKKLVVRDDYVGPRVKYKQGEPIPDDEPPFAEGSIAAAEDEEELGQIDGEDDLLDNEPLASNLLADDLLGTKPAAPKPTAPDAQPSAPKAPARPPTKTPSAIIGEDDATIDNEDDDELDDVIDRDDDIDADDIDNDQDANDDLDDGDAPTPSRRR